jgi:hypothetical protein
MRKMKFFYFYQKLLKCNGLGELRRCFLATKTRRSRKNREGGANDCLGILGEDSYIVLPLLAGVQFVVRSSLPRWLCSLPFFEY